VRLAYLCNLYPAVSHSFVRREIEGVERAGHEVHRFSLRPAHDDLKDEADLREAERTRSILGQGASRLLLTAAGLTLTRPFKTAKAFGAAMHLSGPGIRSHLRHVAYWLEAGWLFRQMNQLRIEHLHAHFGTNPAAVAAIAAAWGGPPFSFTVHGPDEFDAPITLGLRTKINASTFVAAISSFGRSQLMRWSEPADWAKIKVIRCGVDEAFLAAKPLPVVGDSTEFLCVARLSGQKGLPLLISACAALHQAGERFSLTIIGDGELRNGLQDQVLSQGLSDRVIFAGVRSSTEIREYLSRARAFVLPSFAEGLPVVIMEALAMTRPVIATSIAGIPELVDEECGWLIPAGNESELVRAMSEALHSSSQELTAKGNIGRKRVIELHSAQKNAAELVSVIADASALTCTR
jgi:colanic acid/amylovoran biosynthesis glycosyltransferase